MTAVVLKGGVRGHGRQLARYLLAVSDNDCVRILDTDHAAQPDAAAVHGLLRDMDLMAQLSRSRKGIYHAILNPAPALSQLLQEADWLQAAELIADVLGMAGQRRLVVLHEKRGRVHAHIAIDRFDPEKRRMIPISHNYRKHDKARKLLERQWQQQFGVQPVTGTVEMKRILTQLWQQHADGPGFIAAAQKAGYSICQGAGRQPFVVTTGTAAFNLVRQLDGVRLRDVRERLSDCELTQASYPPDALRPLNRTDPAMPKPQ